jgi:tetratricopeptide (TPR) repeat protein
MTYRPSPFAFRPRALSCAALVLLALGGTAQAASARPSNDARAQLGFGIDMAKRGLWREALFRFTEAEKLAPESPGILNNLAVAYEATGAFDKALDYYQRALKVSPTNRDLRNNYTRFIEFYQSFRGEKKKGPGGAPSFAPAGQKGQKGTPRPPSGRDAADPQPYPVPSAADPRSPSDLPTPPPPSPR